MQQTSYISSMAPRTMLDMLVQKEMGVLAAVNTAMPSPHRRINAPRSLLAFAHIHGEAGTPTLAIWSAMVGRNGPFLCAERKEG
jgi:hypothetical protein